MRIGGGAGGFCGGGETTAEPAGHTLPFVGGDEAEAADQINRSEQRQAEQEVATEPTYDGAADQHDAPPALAPSECREADLPGEHQVLSQAEKPQRDGGGAALLCQLIGRGLQRRNSARVSYRVLLYYIRKIILLTAKIEIA